MRDTPARFVTQRIVAAALLLAAAGPVRAQPSRWPQPGSRGEVLDRVVAVVEGEVMTRSMLAFETRVALVARGGQRAAEEQPDLEAMRAALPVLIGEKLAQAEAERLAVFEVEATEVDAALQTFKRQLAPTRLDAFLESADITPGELLAMLRRRLRVERYFARRFESEGRATPQEVEAWVSLHAQELGDTSQPELREAVRQQLAREHFAQRVQRELRRLYGKAKVRIVDPDFVGTDASLRPRPEERGP